MITGAQFMRTPIILLVALALPATAHEIQQCEIDAQAPEPASERTYTASTLSGARSGFVALYGIVARDCDPVTTRSGPWTCSDEVIGSGAPALSSAPSAPEPAPIPTNGQRLISLHFDNAPDHDDGHSLVADRVLLDFFGLDAHAVNGTHGHALRHAFQTASEPLFAAAYPAGLNAYRDWSGSVAATAAVWSSTIGGGGSVIVADGGPMDFTADVLRQLPSDYRKSVTVVQHSSGFNTGNTSAANLSYIKNAANLKVIDDGNRVNGTADLNEKSASFVAKARASQHSGLWNAAFNYLNPNTKLDFSDSVELLYILGIGKSRVANADDFAREFIQ